MMKSLIFLLTFLFMAFAYELTSPFIDIYEEIKDPKCLTDHYKVFALRVYQSVGKLDPNFAKNFNKLKPFLDNKQINQIGGYIAPCTKCDVVKQVSEIVLTLKNAKIDLASILVTGSEWDKDVTKNQAFLKAFVAEYTKSGIFFAIITDEFNWNRIMGKDYSEFKNNLLWYIRHDKDPENINFKPFGGWTKALAKQYDDANICGVKFNIDSEYKQINKD